MKTIPRHILKRHLPALLLRHRKNNLRLAVMRKRDAHDPRLPENRLAKIKAAQQAAVNRTHAIRMASLQKQAAKAELQAALADAPAVEAA